MNFELSGKLIEKFDIIQVNDTFRKREFVVETSENNAGREFIEQIKFQLIQDKCEIIDNFSIDDNVKVKFNIKGRRWEKEDRVNYFINLDAWKIEAESKIDEGAPPPDDFDAPFTDDIDDVPF
ncbi:DUF3127 domain-containing protein [Bacteroidota bacterium]